MICLMECLGPKYTWPRDSNQNSWIEMHFKEGLQGFAQIQQGGTETDIIAIDSGIWTLNYQSLGKEIVGGFYPLKVQ